MTFSFPPLLCRHLLCICIDQLRTWQHSIVSQYTFIISDLQITLSLLSILQFFYSTWSNPPPPSLFHYTDRHSQHTHRHRHTKDYVALTEKRDHHQQIDQTRYVAAFSLSYFGHVLTSLPTTHIYTPIFSLSSSHKPSIIERGKIRKI